MLSYTSVQQTPPAYNGRQTIQSTDPATADQPRRAPQLNARPDGVEGSEPPVRSMELRIRTEHSLRPVGHSFHERVDDYN
jgi:hypothetical protein